MTTTVAADLVTNAVVALLRTELDPVKIGDGRAPEPTPTQDTVTQIDLETMTTQPYVVVWGPVPIGEGETVYLGDSYCGQPESMERIRYQIMGVGRTRVGAEGVARTAAAVLTDRAQVSPFDWVNAITVAGHEIYDRGKAGWIAGDEEGGLFQRGLRVDLSVCVV